LAGEKRRKGDKTHQEDVGECSLTREPHIGEGSVREFSIPPKENLQTRFPRKRKEFLSSKSLGSFPRRGDFSFFKPGLGRVGKEKKKLLIRGEKLSLPRKKTRADAGNGSIHAPVYSGRFTREKRKRSGDDLQGAQACRQCRTEASAPISSKKGGNRYFKEKGKLRDRLPPFRRFQSRLRGEKKKRRPFFLQGKEGGETLSIFPGGPVCSSATWSRFWRLMGEKHLFPLPRGDNRLTYSQRKEPSSPEEREGPIHGGPSLIKKKKKTVTLRASQTQRKGGKVSSLSTRKRYAVWAIATKWQERGGTHSPRDGLNELSEREKLALCLKGSRKRGKRGALRREEARLMAHFWGQGGGKREQPMADGEKKDSSFPSTERGEGKGFIAQGPRFTCLPEKKEGPVPQVRAGRPVRRRVSERRKNKKPSPHRRKGGKGEDRLTTEKKSITPSPLQHTVREGKKGGKPSTTLEKGGSKKKKKGHDPLYRGIRKKKKNGAHPT